MSDKGRQLDAANTPQARGGGGDTGCINEHIARQPAPLTVTKLLVRAQVNYTERRVIAVKAKCVTWLKSIKSSFLQWFIQYNKES